MKLLKRILKYLLWLVGGVIGLVLLVLVLLYIPPVQNFVFDKIVSTLNKGEGLNISYGSLRLKFPTHVEGHDLEVRIAPDMEAKIGYADLPVKLSSLLKMNVAADDVFITDASFRIGTPDSLLYLNAGIDTLNVSDLSISLPLTKIQFDKTNINGCDVRLFINGESPEKPDSSEVTTTPPMDILASQIEMSDVDFKMHIYNSIDTLSAKIGDLLLNSGAVSLHEQQIDVKSANIDQVIATYIYFPPQNNNDDQSVRNEEESILNDSLLWKINVDEISLSANRAIYALLGATPQMGFDLNYIEVNDVEIKVDSFYNAGPDIIVPLKKLQADERSGLSLNASGLFSMIDGLMKVSDFRVSLPGSNISMNGEMGLVSPRYPTTSQCPVDLNLDANVSTYDIINFMPSTAPLFANIPKATSVDLGARISGNMDDIKVNRIYLTLPRLLNLSAEGSVSDFQSGRFMDLTANLNFHGWLINSNIVKPSVVESKLGKGIRLYPFTIAGNISCHHGWGKGDIEIKSDKGEISLLGNLNLRPETYDLDLNVVDFPIQSFLPDIGVRDVSANLTAKGNGFDLFKPTTTADVRLDLSSLTYNSSRFEDIVLSLNLKDGNARLRLDSDMEYAEAHLDLDGNLVGVQKNWFVNGNLRNINLYELGLSKVESEGSLQFNGNAAIDTDSMYINAFLNFPSIQWENDLRNIYTTNLNLHFEVDRKSTSLDVLDHDLSVNLSSPLPLNSIINRLDGLKSAIDSCVHDSRVNVDLLQKNLPPFIFNLKGGNKNIIGNFMASTGERFDTLSLKVINDSILNLKSKLTLYRSLKSRADTLSLNIFQKNDSLDLIARLENGPNSPGDWADVSLTGRIGGDEIMIRFIQKNTANKTGFDIGLKAQYADSTVTLRFLPRYPIIGYTDWTLNKDNFIKVDFASKHLDANLSLSNPKSSLRLYTDHIEGTESQEEINLALNNIQISDWISLNPFATPVKGLLSGNVSLSQQNKSINGKGNIELADLYYGKQRVGTFDLGLNVVTKKGGFVNAEASLSVDSTQVLTLDGVLNDTTQNPFQLSLAITSLPLKIANPFLYDAGISLSGKLDGKMDITGTTESPVFNGYIDFDSAGVNVGLLGETYRLSEAKIPVDTGIVLFDNYTISAANDDPLIIDGTVNMRDFINPRIDLSLTAKNTQLLGTDRARGKAEVFGKLFVDLDASAKGDMSLLKVDADATILRNTDVSYMMIGGGKTALQSRSNNDLVKFVNFADSFEVNAADSIVLTGMLLSVRANLKIDRGAKLNVDLSSDGKNMVSIEPEGDLEYSRDVMGHQTLTGRININDGFARYTPPFMTEKMFAFQEGSYVDFHGDIENPILNIHAVDHLRANVTQEGQNSRLIYFNIGLDVTGSLSNMNVAFDLSTDDDITVQNELASMSPSQRASQAMNLLLTNIYSGPGTKGDANLGANALYAFLGSTLNTWAANNIKAVDLSFGVNQYENTIDGVTSQATSYSYRVSKSLFDDRFKIVVGGSYTSDADVDEDFTQELISDISFEYIINKSGSMVIKIFRHTGYESILEGEVTQTGVGFTYRKRMDSLKHMFHFLFPHWHDHD